MLDNLLAQVMRNLPPDDFKTIEDRDKWLRLFHAAFELLYPDKKDAPQPATTEHDELPDDPEQHRAYEDRS